MQELGEFLQSNHSLLSLDMGMNNISDKGIEILVDYLRGNTTLKFMNLQDNSHITNASTRFLKDMIAGSYVRQINLCDTSISNESKEEIKQVLSIAVERREIPIFSRSKSAMKLRS